MFSFNLQEAIDDAKRERQSRGPTKAIHAVICRTVKQGKKYMTNHHCSRCWNEVRYFSTSNSLRGKSFNDFSAIHVVHYDPILWRDLGMCLAFSYKFSGPIFMKIEPPKFGPLDEADECTCGLKPCACWHDEK